MIMKYEILVFFLKIIQHPKARPGGILSNIAAKGVEMTGIFAENARVRLKTFL